MVHQRGFADIGITDQCDTDHLATILSLYTFLFVDIHQVAFQLGNLIQDDTFVGFQLGFTRSAHTNTTTLAFQVGPQAGQARKHVFILCQFDLRFCMGCLGTAGEYVEYQAGTVEYFHLEFFFNITKLLR